MLVGTIKLEGFYTWRLLWFQRDCSSSSMQIPFLVSILFEPVLWIHSLFSLLLQEQMNTFASSSNYYYSNQRSIHGLVTQLYTLIPFQALIFELNLTLLIGTIELNNTNTGYSSSSTKMAWPGKYNVIHYE